MGEFLGLLPGEWVCCLERCLDSYEHRGTAGYLLYAMDFRTRSRIRFASRALIRG
jgi:hypothetical protein